ncbi:cell division topological specificity factor MinE [Methylocapsa palsarum]|uniref:Cell division topological specificity factor n=1 Tax=Methylocapsa palsarum TaxID=1612308 RepID=A0A1I3XB74_9HYPH|nr:cell division topological specificity factor MinE [Methylocapsa palsarum]
MNLISFFRRTGSAPVARERLQILLQHERAVTGKSDLIAILQEEIMAVIAKHFPVESDSIKIKMERGNAVSTLEVEVEIPTPMCVNISVNAPKARPTLKAVEKTAETAGEKRKERPTEALAAKPVAEPVPEPIVEPVEIAAEAEG